MIPTEPTVSPRLTSTVLARYPDATRPPAPHTAPELLRLMALLDAAGARTVAIGHGRHPASVAATAALAERWPGDGRAVLIVLDWPVDAASWLRPARRLAAADADAVVMADTPAGCAQLGARLAEQPSWSPARTFGFASVASFDLLALTRPGVLSGMTGPTSTGGAWRITPRSLIIEDVA